MNLVTVKLFTLRTLHYGAIGPTALERDVCPSVWCGYSVRGQVSGLVCSGYCTASKRSGRVHSLPWGVATQLFANDFGEDFFILIKNKPHYRVK